MRVEPTEETPFRILVMGDFSGRAGRSETPAQRRLKPVVIDRDNFDDVMAGLEVQLHVGGKGDQGVRLQFSELDDFHPDRIYQQSQLFQQLREARRKLEDPKTFAEASAEIQGWSQEPIAPAATRTAVSRADCRPPPR